MLGRRDELPVSGLIRVSVFTFIDPDLGGLPPEIEGRPPAKLFFSVTILSSYLVEGHLPGVKDIIPTPPVSDP